MKKPYLDILTRLHRAPSKVLHVGANKGQEVGLYAALGIEAWHIEAVPAAYAELVRRCESHCTQHALNALVSDAAHRLVSFNVATNGFQSSSMLPLGRHSAAYPHVTYQDQPSSALQLSMNSSRVGNFHTILILWCSTFKGRNCWSFAVLQRS
jgi:hypothetical protein